jgi:hypothetical protein
VGRVFIAVVVAGAIFCASIVFVVASAFIVDATAETPNEMYDLEYGWPIAFAESDASMGASPLELRSGEWVFPYQTPFNPWENSTTFDGGAFWTSVGLVSASLFLAVGAIWSVRRRLRAKGGPGRPAVRNGRPGST